MKRHAFKMQLMAGVVAEYNKRNDEIWPELSRALHDAGISDYAIFLDEESLSLFAVQKQTDSNTAAEQPNLPIVKKQNHEPEGHFSAFRFPPRLSTVGLVAS